MLSKNFWRSEFECKGNKCCGHSAPIDRNFIDKLQRFRDIAGTSVEVTSGFRCKVHNKAIGGSENSTHCLGIAADIMCVLPTQDMLRIAEEVGFKGIGVYPNRIHVDDREKPARWSGI